MLLRRIIIENVRSFLDRAELSFDGLISIVIGPNGGGKTNLLDTTVIVLRRYIFASRYAAHAPTPENPNRYEFRHNDVLNNMTLERHNLASRQIPQLIEIELEVTKRDIENMQTMRNDAVQLHENASTKYINFEFSNLTQQWKFDNLHPGTRIKFRLVDGNLQQSTNESDRYYLEYLQHFEIDAKLRDEFGLAALTTPMIYLPVNRSANGFQSAIQLANFNEYEQKRQNDGVISTSNNSIIALAVGRLAQKFRLLLEKDKGIALKEFKEDTNLKELTKLLGELGYEWNLVCTDPLKNHYDIQLTKQGSSFLVGRASSGERELLTYLFSIFALNVRDAVIVVDEPELHLHPKWQKTLLSVFEQLSKTTGNQFLLATHAPAFISPDSIQYVSRVFSDQQRSRIIRLSTTDLPDAKHLFNIVNSQNNERIFFADNVVLVEGLSDRIFFEAVVKHYKLASTTIVTEFVDVGGKGFFNAYSKLLSACKIQYSIVADLDYVEEVGTTEVKALLELDPKEIKKDVIDNIKSLDGHSLVARIDDAMLKADWSDAQELWQYILSRHRRLRTDLTPTEKALLNRFIEEKAASKIYLLRKGALEDYLSEGFRSKDLNKLIEFVSEPDFLDKLSKDTRDELDSILGKLMQST